MVDFWLMMSGLSPVTSPVFELETAIRTGWKALGRGLTNLICIMAWFTVLKLLQEFLPSRIRGYSFAVLGWYLFRISVFFKPLVRSWIARRVFGDPENRWTEPTKRLWTSFPSRRSTDDWGRLLPPWPPLPSWSSLSEWDDVLAAVAEGAKVNARNNVDNTGLHQALRLFAPLTVVEAMVEAGGDVNAAGLEGQLALHFASSYKSPHCEEGLAIVKYLISKGAKSPTLFVPDCPIHAAARANNLPVLRYWVEDKGDDPETKDFKGRTPLHRSLVALSNALDTTAYLVVVCQANPHAASFDGKTPLDKAYGDAKQFMELWTHSWMQTIIHDWRYNDEPPTYVTADMYDKLFAPESSGQDRLSVLRFIARHHQTNLTVRCVMAGTTGVGKTSLVTKAVKPQSTTTVDGGEAGRTRGLDVSLHRVSRGVDAESGALLPSCNIVWQDFGGHVEYWALQGGFLGWDCVVFVTFDLEAACASSSSGVEEVGLWLDSIADKLDWERGSSVGVVLVGTKLDRVPKKRAVPCLRASVGQFGRRVKAWALKAEEHRRRREERHAAELAGAGDHSAPPLLTRLRSFLMGPSSPSTRPDMHQAWVPPSSPTTHQSPIKLLAATAVSSVANTAFLLPHFRRPDAPSVTDIHSMLLYVLHVAPEHLPGYFGVERQAWELEASERVLATSGPSRAALFGGRWAMSREEYEVAVRSILDLPPNTDIVRFTEYMVSVGAFLTCGDVVVVDPSRVAAVLSSVVSHRYVGIAHHDPITASEVCQPGCDPAVLAEVEAMAVLRAKLSQEAVVLGMDEQLFVEKSQLTKRLLGRVLLHPDRPRCLVSKMREGDVEAVWGLLQTFEYGVLMDGETLFLPFLYTLREVCGGAATAGHLGVGAGVEAGSLPVALSGPGRSRSTSSWVIHRRVVVGRLPWRSFASMLHGLLSPSLDWARVRQSVSHQGLMVHVTSRVLGVPGLEEHVVVWVTGSSPSPSSPSPRSAAPSTPGSPSPSPFTAQASSLVLRLQGQCEVHVASWYEGCSVEAVSALCYGTGGPFGVQAPWLGFVEALAVVRVSLSSVSIKESAFDFRSESWIGLNTVVGQVSTFGVHGGSEEANMMHLMAHREVDRMSTVRSPKSADGWRCSSCQHQRRVVAMAALSSSTAPASASKPWIIKSSSISKVQRLEAGGFGEVWRAKYNGQDAVIKVVKPTNKDGSALDSDKARQLRSTLEKEVEYLSTLSHPNVVRVYGKTDTGDGMVMEYIHGGDLRGWLVRAARRCVSAETTVDVFVEGLRLLHDTACGMAFLHQKDVLHCDLKPLNVLLGITPDARRQQAKVADLGVSQRFDASSPPTGVGGTRSYMAPEVGGGGWAWEGDVLFGKGLVSSAASSSPSASSSSASTGGTGRGSHVTPTDDSTGTSTVSGGKPEPVPAPAPSPPLATLTVPNLAKPPAPTAAPPPSHPITLAIDVWAFGIMLSCLLSMCPKAWKAASLDRQSLTVPAHVIEAVAEVKRRSKVDVVELMRQCLSRSPSSRPLFEEVAFDLKTAVVSFSRHRHGEEDVIGVEESKADA